MFPGKRLQHYVLIEQVGKGGQAAVWSAEDELLKRTVAIKTISLKESSGDATMGSIDMQASRFRSEARTIADLEHPYILPVYTFGQDEDWLYIVMRYMAGGTLRKTISGGLSLEQTIKLAGPLADALDQAHQKQIIHRDIKSVNVLLDSQRRPYLADFGLSVTAGDSSSQSGSGTLAYMAPEQLKGNLADHRSDLYSFGTMVYEMLTGNTPRVNDAHWNIMQLTAGSPLPLPSQLEGVVGNVLRRSMAIDPADRYPNAVAMVEALKDGLATFTPITQNPNAGELFTLSLTEEPTQISIMETLSLTGMETITLSLDDTAIAGFALELLPVDDPALVALTKANDLFNTALNDWADGAGRFRLYSDDYKFIDSFYGGTDTAGIELTDAGKRLMFRAAMEHDYKISHWWGKLDQESDQRSVALQTLNSEIPSARLRAIQYLTLMNDSNPPAIPIRVATIIRRDPESSVRLAGVILLEERATASATWREAAYSPVIDETLGYLASQEADPQVLEQAARTIGRLRSLSAAREVAKRAAEDPRAMLSLTQIRDEAGSFPAGIDSLVQRTAFIRLTVRQLFGEPLTLLSRYAWLVLGFALALGSFGYSVIVAQGGQAFGLSALFATALNIGITYGFFFALGAFLALEPARRLRAWGAIPRVAIPAALGGLVTFGAFSLFRALFNNIPDPLEQPGFFILPSLIFPVGFALGAALTQKIWARTLIAAVSMILGLLINWATFAAGTHLEYMLYLDPKGQLTPLSVAYMVWIGVLVGVFGYLPEWSRAIRQLWSRLGL